MLDLYLLEDAEEMPQDDAPNQEQYLGSLDLGQVEMLKCVRKVCFMHGIVFEYFDDTRWFSDDVIVVLEGCRQCYEAETNPKVQHTIELLVTILNRAVESQCGIAAYCD